MILCADKAPDWETTGMHVLAFLFGTGLDEWALLGAIAFLLFGPKRLPEIARTLGRTLEKLRRAADEFRAEVAHLDDPPAPPSPPHTFGNPPPGALGLEPGPRIPYPASPNQGPVAGVPDPIRPEPGPRPPDSVDSKPQVPSG